MTYSPQPLRNFNERTAFLLELKTRWGWIAPNLDRGEHHLLLSDLSLSAAMDKSGLREPIKVLATGDSDTAAIYDKRLQELRKILGERVLEAVVQSGDLGPTVHLDAGYPARLFQAWGHGDESCQRTIATAGGRWGVTAVLPGGFEVAPKDMSPHAVARLLGKAWGL